MQLANAFCRYLEMACVRFLEGIGDVFQKKEAEDDMLVFGRVHAAAQGVGHLPELGFVAGRGAMGARLRIGIGLLIFRSSSCHLLGDCRLPDAVQR